MSKKTTDKKTGTINMEKFRLRNFVERLIEIDEVEIHDEPVALAHLSAIIESTPKAVLFRDAGPEHFEIVSSVAGGRRRLAEAGTVVMSRSNSTISVTRACSLDYRTANTP